MTGVDFRHGDCLDVMRRLIADGVTVRSVVTDPPYHLTSIVKRFGSKASRPARRGTAANHTGAYARASAGFMGKKWDGGDIAFRPEVWELCLQLLKPGGHLLAFSGTRTYHRMACAIEDAGFEIRDQIAWLYGSGFPKSHDVSKAIDAAAGAERPVAAEGPMVRRIRPGADQHGDATWEKLTDRTYTHARTEPVTEAAKQWEGWGTALKPALEPIAVARKPLSEKSVAANVLAHEVGAINVDGSRIGSESIKGTRGAGGQHGKYSPIGPASYDHEGRWPANVAHDGSDEVEAAFAQFGDNKGAFAPSPIRAYGDDGSTLR